MKNLLLFFALLLLVSACKKSDDNSNNNNTNPQPTQQELITKSPWYYKSWVVDPAEFDEMDSVWVSDVYAHWDACEKDNFFKFYNTGTVDFNEGTLRCDTTIPQYSTYTYKFIGTDKLQMAGSEYTLVALTADSMKLSFKEVGATTHTHSIVFRH